MVCWEYVPDNECNDFIGSTIVSLICNTRRNFCNPQLWQVENRLQTILRVAILRH